MGLVQDIIIYKNGHVEKREESFNTIINGIGKLAAALFKGDPAYTPLSYWAVGQGAATWDALITAGTITYDMSTTRLVNELGRKSIPLSSMTFVNDDGDAILTLNNRIKITVLFDWDECNGEWREFGIFGGNATSGVNTGIMVNHKIHKLINKTNEMKVERSIIFTFN